MLIELSLINKWNFEIDIAEDGLTGSIAATSTENMSGGADHTVTLSIETGDFTGYGQSGSDDEDSTE